jgi:recombination protein RecT
MSDDQTVTGTVARQVPLQPLIEQYAPEFGKLLPAHVGQERYERWMVTYLRKALAGKQADTWQRVLTQPPGQLSVMHAFLDCASLGLEPGRTYHLVPFGGEVTGITDYKGEIQLITNARPHAVVVAQLVRGKDDFAMVGANVPPRHEADWFAVDRGPVVGGYAFVSYGAALFSLVIRMGEDEFLRHREKAKTKTVWDEWPESMRLKTLVHQLRKWVPWSPEVRP